MRVRVNPLNVKTREYPSDLGWVLKCTPTDGGGSYRCDPYLKTFKLENLINESNKTDLLESGGIFPFLLGLISKVIGSIEHKTLPEFFKV
jgi:hypothetical protein